jgi:ABC-type Fe3+ transport system permease subunit
MSRTSRRNKLLLITGIVTAGAVALAGCSALRLIWPMLAPAIWSALAIGFAESISDFGVAATLA